MAYTIVYIHNPVTEKVAIFREDLRVQLFDPVPHTGSFAFLIEALTSDEPKILAVKDIGEPIPNKLSLLENWPEVAKYEQKREHVRGQAEAVIGKRIVKVINKQNDKWLDL